MRNMRKCIAVLLTVITALSMCVTAGAVPGENLLKKETALTINALSERKTDVFNVMKSISSLLAILGNNKVLPDNALDVRFTDDLTDELCTYIKENSDLDVEWILKNIPLGGKGLKLFYKVTGADAIAIRDSVYALSDKCHEKNIPVLGDLLYFFGAYLGGIENVEVYSRRIRDDGTEQVRLTVNYTDGSRQDFPVDVYFSPEGLVYGNSGKGFLGLGYECSVYDLVIYTTVNCWMRDFGFDLLYDIFCYATPFFNYITRRYKFEYDGMEWMVQSWKGNYVITNGAEVGIYNREKGSMGTYYNCYDGVTDMSLKLYTDDNVFFDRSEQHWWISGFKLSKKLFAPTKMTAEYSIAFPSVEMAEKFCDAVNSDPVGDAVCTVSGKTAYVVW